MPSQDPDICTPIDGSQATTSEPLVTHNALCDLHDSDVDDICLSVVIGRRNGALVTTVRFPTGDQIKAQAGDPDLGFSEADTCLHDIAHTLLTARLGLDRSPVLERVVDLRPLTQEAVDLEEAAIFAIQAFCASLRGEDHRPHIANIRTALDRLEA